MEKQSKRSRKFEAEMNVGDEQKEKERIVVIGAGLSGCMMALMLSKWKEDEEDCEIHLYETMEELHDLEKRNFGEKQRTSRF